MQFRNFKIYPKSYSTASTTCTTTTTAHATSSSSTVGSNNSSSNRKNTRQTRRKNDKILLDNCTDFFESSYYHHIRQKNFESINNESQNTNSGNSNLINFTSNLNPSVRYMNSRNNSRMRMDLENTNTRRKTFASRYNDWNNACWNSSNRTNSWHDYGSGTNGSYDNYYYGYNNDNNNNNNNNNNKHFFSRNTFNKRNEKNYTTKPSGQFNGINTLGANVNYINIDQQLDMDSYNHCKKIIMQRRNSIDTLPLAHNNTCSSIRSTKKKVTGTSNNNADNGLLQSRFVDGTMDAQRARTRTRSKSISIAWSTSNQDKLWSLVCGGNGTNFQYLSKKYFTTQQTKQSQQTIEEFNANHDCILFTKTELQKQQQQQQQQPQQAASLNTTVSPWPVDTEVSFNKSSFLQQNIKEIDLCFNNGDFNKINSLYMALKRNEIFPPLPTFEKIIISFCLRDLDSKNLDERMFNLLNCYQDLINSKKYHPSDVIYDNIISTLLEGSIMAKNLNNYNGLDFFKIAIELYKTVEQKSLQKPSEALLSNLLVSINLYPGYISFSTVSTRIAPLVAHKNTLYYIALLKYCEDPLKIESLINEYKNKNIADESDSSNKYKVFTAGIESLLKTDNLEKASAILDSCIMEIKTSNGQSGNIQLLLSRYLITLSGSKENYKKAYKLWYKFSKLSWIPPFTNDFYLQFLSNVLNNNDWELACRLYYYMYSTSATTTPASNGLTASAASKITGNRDLAFANATTEENQIALLLKPLNLDYIHSNFLNMALEKNSSKLVLTILEESMLKQYRFALPMYNKVFQYLKQYHKSKEDYLLRFINIHGSLMVECSNYEKFEFLNSIIKNYKSQTILNGLSKQPFFEELCKSFKTVNNFNYSGLICVFESMWKSPQSILSSSHNLELHAYIVAEFYNLDYQFENLGLVVEENKVLEKFKVDVTEKFKRLMINYKRLNLDPTVLSDRVVHLATRVLDIDEIESSDFTVPGDWDKTYPVHLGSKIRTSRKQGLKDYQILLSKGYSFDWDTYNSLMMHSFIDESIVTNLLKLSPSAQKTKDAFNTLIASHTSLNLERYIFNHKEFNDVILPILNERSLMKIIKNVKDLPVFLATLDFTNNFKSIKKQIEFESFITLIYEKLFFEKKFVEILELNKSVPVLNLNILLKCYLRSGKVEEFSENFAKWSSKLTSSEVQNLKAEHLINCGKYDEALECLNTGAGAVTPHKSNDLRTFICFIKSCCRQDIAESEVEYPVENTLQLANILSRTDSLQEMRNLYGTFMENNSENNFSVSGLTNKKISLLNIKYEILDQILNNFQSVLELESESEIVGATIFTKLSNYFKFRKFLLGPYLGGDEFLKIMDIWHEISMGSLDQTFNNIAETLYYDKNSAAIIVKDDCMIDSELLPMVLAKFNELYKDEEDSGKKLDKIQLLIKMFESK